MTSVSRLTLPYRPNIHTGQALSKSLWCSHRGIWSVLYRRNLQDIPNKTPSPMLAHLLTNSFMSRVQRYSSSLVIRNSIPIFSLILTSSTVISKWPHFNVENVWIKIEIHNRSVKLLVSANQSLFKYFTS